MEKHGNRESTSQYLLLWPCDLLIVFQWKFQSVRVRIVEWQNNKYERCSTEQHFYLREDSVTLNTSPLPYQRHRYSQILAQVVWSLTESLKFSPERVVTEGLKPVHPLLFVVPSISEHVIYTQIFSLHLCLNFIGNATN